MSRWDSHLSTLRRACACKLAPRERACAVPQVYDDLTSTQLADRQGELDRLKTELARLRADLERLRSIDLQSLPDRKR